MDFRSRTNSTSTRTFLPPETLRRNQPGDARSDIYALGMTLWVLSAGKMPFSCDSLPHLIEQVCDLPLPDPRGHDLTVRYDLANLICTATARDPADRYQTIEAFSLAADHVFDASRLSRIRPAVPSALHPLDINNPELKSETMFDDSKIGRPIPLSKMEPPPIPNAVSLIFYALANAVF